MRCKESSTQIITENVHWPLSKGYYQLLSEEFESNITIYPVYFTVHIQSKLCRPMILYSVGFVILNKTFTLLVSLHRDDCIYGVWQWLHSLQKFHNTPLIPQSNLK